MTAGSTSSKILDQSLCLYSLFFLKKRNAFRTKPPFNHPGQIGVKAFDSYSSLQTLQVREQVGEAEHEMCCYANNTYLSLGMKWEAGSGIASLYTHALNHYEPREEGKKERRKE